MFGQRKPVVNRKAALIEYGQSLLWFAGAVAGAARVHFFIFIFIWHTHVCTCLTSRSCSPPAALKGTAYAIGLFNKH